MAVLDIREDGDPVLRQVAEPVPRITKQVRRLIKDMMQTMRAAEGIGLAAPQVGVSKRIIVVDTGEDVISLVNPRIESVSGEEIGVEGCLSIPGKQGYVKRAREVTVSGVREDGTPVRYRAEGLVARIFQHEIDHLDGVLFIDKVIDEVVEAEEPDER